MNRPYVDGKPLQGPLAPYSGWRGYWVIVEVFNRQLAQARLNDLHNADTDIKVRFGWPCGRNTYA